ncbi:hypothetical protein [Streptomyces deccanensis]|uniref:hypothetical protein n=1 Tax=Streptomyces deccanensis TaxID=424188 RepID=UPI001EFBA559|nr:hypothetical protein [Streptomyces deccanensis]ULR51011.1 hypothetical protein L3078_17850 [Streptomyces deccanensis]
MASVTMHVDDFIAYSQLLLDGQGRQQVGAQVIAAASAKSGGAEPYDPSVTIKGQVTDRALAAIAAAS